MSDQKSKQQSAVVGSRANAHQAGGASGIALPSPDQFAYDAAAIQAMTRKRAANAALPPPPSDNKHVVQGKFIINNVEKTGDDLKEWIETYAYGKPEIEAVIMGWAKDGSNTTNHSNDIKAYEAAKKEVEDTISSDNATIGEQIQASGAPAQIGWDAYPVWSAWYFSGLEYQDNKTGGWHSNRKGLLPGTPTDDGAPTRYVEFRRPGAIGTKEKDKMERCIFDLVDHRCWPNAHYDGGYVEITGVPTSVKKSLFEQAYVSTGLKQRRSEMTEEEKATAGAGKVLVQWLIDNLKSDTSEDKTEEEGSGEE